MQFDEIVLENMKELENRESENENLLSGKISESEKKYKTKSSLNLNLVMKIKKKEICFSRKSKTVEKEILKVQNFQLKTCLDCFQSLFFYL